MADDGPQRTLSRVTEIGRVATRHGFGYLLDRRRSGDGEQDGDRGRRLREMFDELGPTFVKFGQLLSTRPDVVPPDIIAELRKLQDDVSPVADGGRRARHRRGARPHRRAGVPRLRRDADRGGVDRPGAPGDAAQRRPGRRQGAAPERGAPDRVRPQADGVGGARRPRARPPARLHRHGRAGRRVRPLDPPRARLPAGGPQRRDVPAELRRRRADRGAARLVALHDRPAAHARPARGDARPRPRPRAHGTTPRAASSRTR